MSEQSMQETFRILDEFLERNGNDVEGRSLEALPAELSHLLKAFAAGKLEDGDRARVAERLKQCPAWVAALAGEAKALRTGPVGPEPESH